MPTGPYARRQCQRGRGAALQPRAGRATRTAIAVRARAAAHLLPEARGPSSSSTAYRKHVPRKPALLIIS